MFKGHVKVVYSDAGCLAGCDFADAILGENQQVWLLRNLPVQADWLPAFLKAAPSLRMQEVPEVVPTFEMFWDKYNDKIASSKKKSLARWNKMSDADKIKAYRFIDTYFRNIPNNCRKKIVETYLNSELWNN